MKALTAVLGILLLGATFAGGAQTKAAPAANSGIHRYLVERTFPAGALDGLDAALKAKINANNLPVDTVSEIPVTLLPK